MPTKTLRPVKKTNPWTENRKEDKAKVSTISKSKSRTDGSPLQTVGLVSYSLARSPCFSSLPEKWLCVLPCVTGGVCAHRSVRRCATDFHGPPTQPSAAFAGPTPVHSSSCFFSFGHDSHQKAPITGHPYWSPRALCIMSSDYSPTDQSCSRGAKDSSSAIAASEANIRNFAPVARIMKTALPDNAKIAKEAKECMQECVSEFISFITSEGQSARFTFGLPANVLLAASEKCQQEKRKTVNGEDILFAMTSLGFENYAEALKIYLSKYREVSAV